MLHQVLFALALLLMPQLSRPGVSPDEAPGVAGRSTSPMVLEGGRPGSRALLVALHGGSFSDVAPVHLAERCRDELSAAARAAGLRLLVPVAPPQAADRRAGSPGFHGGRESSASAGDAGPPSGLGAFQVPWLSAAGESLVFSLIDEEVAAHRADAARIYLAGHGAGATGALMLTARHPERIAAVAAWAGTPPPLWDAAQHVVGLADDPVPALASVPVYLWTARDDVWLDRAALGLLKRGLSVQRPAARLLIEDETGGHGYGAAGPGPGLRFLQGQRRKPPPRHAAANDR